MCWLRHRELVYIMLWCSFVQVFFIGVMIIFNNLLFGVHVYVLGISESKFVFLAVKVKQF